MDRHDAKPRRPSLMAGAEAQRPAPGQPPARILTDLEHQPAARQPRRSTHVRAALVAGMGLLAIATLGWALLASDGDMPLAEDAAAPTAVVEDAPSAPSAPSTATLVDEAPRPSATAPADNPFETGTRPVLADSADPDADPVAATLAAAANAAAASTANANPFSAMEAPPRATGAGRTAASARVAPRPTATGRNPAAPAARTASAPPAREAGLLQTLMENIQQPAEPARDTRAMDRLARRLDRAPMTASAPAASPRAEAPASGKPAPMSPAAVRAELDRCPTGNNLRADWCRRRVCKRAGLDPWACGQR